MQNKFKLYTPVIVVLMLMCVLLAGITLFFDRWLFIFFCIILAVGFSFVFILLSRANRKIGDAIYDLGNDIYYANNESFADSNLPIMAVYNNYEVIWYNDNLLSSVLDDKPVLGEHINKVFPNLDLEETNLLANGSDIEYNNKKYTVFATLGNQGNQDLTVLYFIDNTDLKNNADELLRTRLSVAIVSIDNYSELSDHFEDIQRAKIVGEIESTIRNYFIPRNAYIVRANRDRFLIFVEQQGVDQMREDRFEVLNIIRNQDFEDKFNTTISIGLGHSSTDDLHQSEKIAKQALDMCLGRGGDQAAIKKDDGYDFFGGVSSGVEQRTKVKSRIIASAIAEFVETSSNVIIMGHRFADLDALGAAVGMLKAVRSINKNSFICIDKEHTLTEQMLKKIIADKNYVESDFRSADLALKALNNRTLLIIVDAHIPNVLESEALYRSAKNVIVIDHHRKLVDFIDDAVIFYHEPFASSASEMVTELIQYFPSKPEINKVEAEALLAGITLDTKNFVMRTGVRTFEAAAWLRRMGADTVEVKKMFSSSMDNYQHKAALVANANNYKNCAIAFVEEEFSGIRVVSSQAADDLMNISGIMASFVVFPYGKLINISARSMGDINVQVIMESLGGGGHRTMAAAQFEDTSIDAIIKKVKTEIDNYYATLSEKQLKELNIAVDLLSTDDNDIAVVEGQELSTVRPFKD